MKSFHATLGSFSVLALAACATMQVETDYDPEVSVTYLSTYDWVNLEARATGDPAVDSPLLRRRIREAVEEELGKMGYRKVKSNGPEAVDGEGGFGRVGDHEVKSDRPDLRISYSVIAEQESRIDESYGYGAYGFGGPYGYSPYSYRGSFGFSYFGGRRFSPYYGYPGAGYAGRVHVREYLRGTLVLDIIDVRTEEVIFRGWAKKSLHSDPSPEKVRMYVTEAVQEILEDFPRRASVG